MEYKCNVIIVIPIYKELLDIFERIALSQVRLILGSYDICFIAPKGLNINYGEMAEGIKVEYFSQSFFHSKHTYSKLMMSPEFYKRFLNYEYILIYQLDAFVFSDQLKEFCRLGYDYIGAPVSRWILEWKFLNKRVGNGGFSLRKIQSCIELCRKKDEIIDLCTNAEGKKQLLLWEDVFFAFAGSHPDVRFKTPGYVTAQNFAVEHDGGRAYKKLLGGWRPFGCHAWMQIDYWFWRPLIEEYGYNLPQGMGKQMLQTRKNLLQNYAISRLFRYKNYSEYPVFPFERKHISIWGMGKQGLLCYNFVKAAGLEVKCIYDETVRGGGLPTLKPTKSVLLNECCPIIISTVKYENEIIDRLKKLGKHHGIDYFLWSQLKQDVLIWLVHRLIGMTKLMK